MESWRGLDAASPAAAAAWLAECCGSARWVARMMARRPFGSHAALVDAAREEWWALPPDDWLDAFGHHPRLGDRNALASRFATRDLSAAEQAGVTGAEAAALDALAEGNRRYEARFGFIFIACATGRSAAAVLADLERRLGHDRDRELRVAAGEQAAITEVRLSRPWPAADR